MPLLTGSNHSVSNLSGRTLLLLRLWLFSSLMVIVGSTLDGYFSVREAVTLTEERLAAESSWAATFVDEHESI